MVEKAVVKETLTQEMIESGFTLNGLLAEEQLAVTASLWLYLPEPNLWRLYIASPDVNVLGPRAVYRKIHSVLAKPSAGITNIGLEDISVIPPDHSVLAPFLIGISTVGKAGVRFSNSTINGRLIEGAYVYRLARK